MFVVHLLCALATAAATATVVNPVVVKSSQVVSTVITSTSEGIVQFN